MGSHRGRRRTALLVVLLGLVLALFGGGAAVAAEDCGAAGTSAGQANWASLQSAFDDAVDGVDIVDWGAPISSADSAGGRLAVPDGVNLTLTIQDTSLCITSPPQLDAAIEVPADSSLTLQGSGADSSSLTVIGGTDAGRDDYTPSGAGIGGDGFATAVGAVTIDDMTVSATGGMDDNSGGGIGLSGSGAGIGGGGAGVNPAGSAGPVTIADSTVVATGGAAFSVDDFTEGAASGAGIGGGGSGADTPGDGAQVTVSNSSVTATGGAVMDGVTAPNPGVPDSGFYGSSGAGIGGGGAATGGFAVSGTDGNPGGSGGGLTLTEGASVTANGGAVDSGSIGGSGAGVGGGGSSGQGAGGPLSGDVILNSATLTATAGTDPAGGGTGDGIGSGGAPSDSGGPLEASTGTVAVDGTGNASTLGAELGVPLNVSTAATLEIAADTTLGLNAASTNDGTIRLNGVLSGIGTLDNEGTIVPDAAAVLTVTPTGNNYALTFNSGPGSEALPAQQIYAPTVQAAEQSLPTPTAPAGRTFSGWFTTSGNQVTATTTLASPPNGPRVITLNAEYAAQRSASVLALSSPVAVLYGQAGATVTASVSVDNASPAAGSVQFSVDGAALGAPVAVVNGTAISPELTGAGALTAGVHTVNATFTPSTGTTLPSSATTQLVVNQAASSTALSVSATAIRASVSALAPGSGAPTGSVTFMVGGTAVGTASLSAGTAMLDHAVPTNATQQVAAIYSGDGDFTASSASTSRANPSIRARLTSASPRTRAGWYRVPVTVRFTCSTHGADLTGGCPAAVTLSSNRAGQSVTRTITALNGGVATVTVSGIDIDRAAPSVRVSGVRSGALYGASVPAPRCSASDGLSGVASCRLSLSTTTGSSGVELSTVRYRAVSTDRAGNTRTIRGSYGLLGIDLLGAVYRDGGFAVTAGRSYTIIVRHAASAPSYVFAAPEPVRPAGAGGGFRREAGVGWVLSVHLPTDLFANFRAWTIGVRIGGRVHRVTVRPS